MASQFFIQRYNTAMTLLDDNELAAAVFMKARLSRDHRFDACFSLQSKQPVFIVGLYARQGHRKNLMLTITDMPI
jgi:hypothetical protein